jgi:D-alanine-D-alanine ligase
MRIGLTFDLRAEYLASGFGHEETAEFDSETTIEALEGALARLGFTVDRIGHARRLAERLVAGDRWDLVFNIAEGLKGRSREAQVPALLEAFDVPYVFSDPLTMAAALDKAVAKRLVRDAGVATAPFAVLAFPDDAASVDLPFPLFLKPVAEGTGKGCGPRSRVKTRSELEREVRTLLARFAQPVLAESFLPGREFTVGVIGNGREARVIGVMEIHYLEESSVAVYSFENKEHWKGRIRYALADDGEAIAAGVSALRAYRALECRDAARLDFRSDAEGVPQFLEANPLSGLCPDYSDLPILANLAGLSYDAFLGEIMRAAMDRLGLGSLRSAVSTAA